MVFHHKFFLQYSHVIKASQPVPIFFDITTMVVQRLVSVESFVAFVQHYWE